MTPFTITRAADRERRGAARRALPSSKYLGGGTNLVDLMKMGVERPTHLIDVSRLPLNQISEHQGGVRIGAMVRNSDAANHRTDPPPLSGAEPGSAVGCFSAVAQHGDHGREPDAAHALLLLLRPDAGALQQAEPGVGLLGEGRA